MKLSQGEFYGRTLFRHGIDGMVLSECVYAPSQRIPEHCHSSSYLSVLLSGSYHEMKALSQVSCTAGMALFHPIEESHRDHFGSAGGRLFSVELDANWLTRLSEERTITDDGYVLGRQVFDVARRLVGEVRQSSFNRLYAQGLVLEMLGLLPRSRSVCAETSEPAWLKAIEEDLRESLAESMVLRTLCEEHGIHPSHVARTFKRYRGCSMSMYVRRLRMEKARTYLLESQKKITEIAALLGFADHSHFSRVFRRETGLSPKEVRRIGRREHSRKSFIGA